MTTRAIEPSSERITKWLKKITNDPATVRRILDIVSLDLRNSLEIGDRLRAYPKPGRWNFEPGSPGVGSWYQRKFGTRFRNEDGTLGGENTSENLQQSWRVEVKQITAEVYTNVSYAPRLFDPDVRAHWAKDHGWDTIDEIAEKYASRYTELVLAEIDRKIEEPI